MQNFTLGKKGYTMLLFAFILLIGSSPTFGQTSDCPTVANTPPAQDFCFLQTVGDIVTDGDAIYQTTDNVNDTQPIPDSEILASGTYFAGSTLEDCTRIEITITVNSGPRPVNVITNTRVSGFEFTTCASETFSASNLEDLFTNDTGYNLEVYESEFATIAYTGTLTPGESYFVGQVSTGSGCPSLRTAVGFNPTSIEGPDAITPQTFCEGATVADLEATGTYPNTQAIRWYRSLTGNQPLSENTELINDQTYYASQVVNDSNRPTPPCETSAADRTPVEVEVQPLTPVDSTQSFCGSIGTSNDFRKPQVQDLTPQGGTFYAEETSTTPLDPSTVLIDGEDYFNRDNGDECTQDRITVQLFDTPNAGSTTTVNVCSNDDPFDLVDRINPSILGAPDTDGTFIPALVSGTTIFDPSVDVARQYTYRVEGNADCPTDDSKITVNIQAAPNAGPGGSFDVCSNNIPDILANPAQFAGLIPGGVTPGGTFDPTLIQLAAQFVADPSAPLTTTYTVSNTNCTDSASYTLNVIPGPNAGDDSSVTLSIEQDEVDLWDYINGEPDSGGSFAPGNSDGSLNPADYDPGTYIFTYTVSSSTNDCTDSSELSVTITDEIICPVIADETQEFCESISDANGNNPRRPQVRDLMPTNITWYATATSTEALATTTTLADNEDYFAGNANGDCPSREKVVVIIDDAPNAGATTSIKTCKSEDPFDILSRLKPSILGAADTGGTITPPLASGTTIFDPAVDPARQYIYTVLSENDVCPNDISRITITIITPGPVDAGNIGDQTVCSTDDPILLSGFLVGSGATLGGTFSGDGVSTDGTMFDPSVGPNTDGYIITYSVSADDSPCTTGSDSSTFTITVNEPQDANAGGNVTATYCVAQDQEIDLRTILGDGALTTGSFSTPYEDGLFNPSEAGVGEVIITYTVDGADDCAIGTNTATITITVTDLPDVPVAETPQSFCVIDNPTVGDIVVTGDNVTFYTDAELTDDVDATTALIDDTIYYAVSKNDNGTCRSDSTAIEVNISETSAPTLSTEGDEFCRSDNPSIQDLINNFTGSGVLIYNSSTGGSSIAATTALENGVTYYGASVDGTTGCESSERTSVVTKVEFCGIPEGFSPNGDGINDRFVIPDIATSYPNYSIEVFNRWGNVVFKGNASTPDWDGFANQSGTFGNDVLPVGVYFYILNYNDGQTSPVQGKLYLSI